MGKWMKGLLDAASMKTIMGAARGGVVGVLAGRMSPAGAAWPKKKLKLWADSRTRMVAGWLGDRTLLLALALPEEAGARQRLAADTERELREVAGGNAPAALGFGYVELSAHVGGRIDERWLTEAVLDAVAAAQRALEVGAGAAPVLAAGLQRSAANAAAIEGPGGPGEPAGQTVGRLAVALAAVPPATPVSAAAERFEREPDCHSIVVEVDGRPLGLITRERLNSMLASKFGMPLYWNRTVDKIMEQAPLVAEADMQVEAVARLAMGRPDSQLYDTVVVTERGRYVGGVTVKALLESFASLQAEAARRVNPLTGLPGGDVIRGEIESRVRAGQPFCVYYADLDYFKWFNDTYGYSAGDDMIRYTAQALEDVLQREEGPGRFLGHIGGDDFISVSDCPDPEARCLAFIERFHAGVDTLYGDAPPTAVLDRHGGTVEQPGVSLSIAVICWDGSGTVSHERLSRLAAANKKKAKQRPGSAYAIGGALETSFEERI